MKQKQTVYIDTKDPIGCALWKAIDALSDKQPFLREILNIGFLAKSAGYQVENGQLVQYQKMVISEPAVVNSKDDETIQFEAHTSSPNSSKTIDAIDDELDQPSTNHLPQDVLANLRSLSGMGIS